MGWIGLVQIELGSLGLGWTPSDSTVSVESLGVVDLGQLGNAWGSTGFRWVCIGLDGVGLD